MVTIYTKDNCPHCVSAKSLFRSHGVEFEEINIGQVPGAREFLIQQGHRTMPQIYQDQQLLVEGGFSALSKKDFSWFQSLKD